MKELVRHPHDAQDHRGWTAAGTTVSSQGVWDQEDIEHIHKTGPVERRENFETGDPYPSKISNPHFIRNRILPEEIFPGFEGFHEEVVGCMCGARASTPPVPL